jgi:hypothetical protein
LPLFLLVAGLVGGARARASAADAPGVVHIEARPDAGAPRPLPFETGGRTPDGRTIAVNSRHLSLDGKPWLPVMGEFHYSRYPAAEWSRELAKMKAAGVDIVATYVFWIHHEEAEGRFDWSGQRDLRKFVETCARNGQYVWVRVGPWDHGEARNGGLPDWVVRAGGTRSNDPAYLARVDRFYREIGKQLAGLFWSGGGPIIGVQLENEYSLRGPGQGTEHILTLRRMARAAGLNPPFYSVTGWDNAAVPEQGVIPVFGGYADGFWWRNLTPNPPSANYFFTGIRCEENVGDQLQSKRPDIDEFVRNYPFITAEMGGGMAASYHRRPVLSAADTAAMAVVKLGGGAALYGYYMFHGGTNPDDEGPGLQESRAVGDFNDLPCKGYDYQAPLGEFGQFHPVLADLKTIHLFLRDFGAQLAPMTARLPARLPAAKSDTATPRVAARVAGDRAFLFINNHQRDHPLPDRAAFQVQLDLPSYTLAVPRQPVALPSGAFPIWPVNLDLGGGVALRYSTAQLLCRLDDPRTFVFFAWPGIPVEFAFEGLAASAIQAGHAHIESNAGTVYVAGLSPGTGAAITVRTRTAGTLRIVLLSREQARQTWKASVAGKDRLLLSPATLWFEDRQIHASSTDAAALRIGVYPDFATTVEGFSRAGRDGVFALYSARVAPAELAVETVQLREAGERPPVLMNGEAAALPSPSAFESAARWHIHVPPATTRAAELLLRIDYAGDIARLYSNGRLINDNFYNGSPWEIGLTRLGIARAPVDLELRVLPFRRDAPIYLEHGAREALPPGAQAAELRHVSVVAEYEAVLRVSH